MLCSAVIKKFFCIECPLPDQYHLEGNFPSGAIGTIINKMTADVLTTWQILLN